MIQTAKLELRCGKLLRPVLTRSVAMFGARANLPVDRIDTAVKTADVTAQSTANQEDQWLNAAFQFESGKLIMEFQPPKSLDQDDLITQLSQADLPLPEPDGELLGFQFSS